MNTHLETKTTNWNLGIGHSFEGHKWPILVNSILRLASNAVPSIQGHRNISSICICIDTAHQLNAEYRKQ